jgi:DNA-binding NarL/FixJ family response regulator
MNILIVDDHDVIRQSLGQIIASEFPRANCVKVENGNRCIELLKKESFDLVILDMNLPDMDGISLTEWVLKNNPDQMILVFSMNPVGVFAKRLYQLGVKGYLNKQADISEIVRALRTILTEKKQYLNEDLKAELSQDASHEDTRSPIDKLSKRELSIAQLIAQGKSFEEIATILSIEPSTIRTYKARIYQKLEVSSLHEFLAMANLYKLV